MVRKRTYGAEGWSLLEGQKSLRRGTRVSRLEKRRIMNMEESVNERIENQQLQWYGHVRRMDEKRWPNILLQWSPVGRRKWGQPRTPWRSGIARMMDEQELDERGLK